MASLIRGGWVLLFLDCKRNAPIAWAMGGVCGSPFDDEIAFRKADDPSPFEVHFLPVFRFVGLVVADDPIFGIEWLREIRIEVWWQDTDP